MEAQRRVKRGIINQFPEVKCAFRLKLEDEVCENVKAEIKVQGPRCPFSMQRCSKALFCVVLYNTQQQVQKLMCTGESELTRLRVQLFTYLLCPLGPIRVCLVLLSIVQFFYRTQKFCIRNPKTSGMAWCRTNSVTPFYLKSMADFHD